MTPRLKLRDSSLWGQRRETRSTRVTTTRVSRGDEHSKLTEQTTLKWQAYSRLGPNSPALTSQSL
jgi:hypothetical protein